jgi:hypothetical protein
MASKYPETMIVVVTAHGEIRVETKPDGTLTPALLTIPDNMNLTRINAVAPGVCNYSDAAFADTVISEIKKIYEPVLRKHSPIKLQDLSDQLTLKVKEITKADLERVYVKGTADEQEIQYLQNFNHHVDKICTKSIHRGCSQALNKIYNSEVESTTSDDKILLLNAPGGEINVLSKKFFAKNGTVDIEGPYAIDLANLLKYLRKRGVINIILIDLSCSVFTDPSYKPFTRREERSLRRSATGYGGGLAPLTPRKGKGGRKGRTRKTKNKRNRGRTQKRKY